MVDIVIFVCRKSHDIERCIDRSDPEATQTFSGFDQVSGGDLHPIALNHEVQVRQFRLAAELDCSFFDYVAGTTC